MKSTSTLLLCLLIAALVPAEGRGAAQTSDEFSLAVAQERARAPAPRLDRSALLVQDSVSDSVRAPDGSSIAYFRVVGSARSVWLLDTDDGSQRRLLQSTEAQRLLWTRDSQWLLMESPRQLFALNLAQSAGSRMLSALDGPSTRRLLAVDPVRPDAVVLLEGPRPDAVAAERWRLLRIDVRGREEVLHSSARRITGFAFEQNGRLAYLARLDGEGIGVYRLDDERALHRLLRCKPLLRCSLLPLANQQNELLILGDAAGDPSRLLRMDRNGALHLVHVDPRGAADIEEIAVDPFDGTPLLASHASTRPASHGLGPSTRAHLARIEQVLGARSLSIQPGGSDQAAWLIAERASALQGTRWHLYQPRSKTLHRILADPPLQQRSLRSTDWIAESSLARKIAFDWTASDGMRLHGQVMLPPGRDPAALPLIAQIHGGPWNHVRPGYESHTQLLVNRGYIVFEPDFRGSTGHGFGYLIAARGDYGNGRVQQDIVDGVRALLAKGIGDSQRVGISGASFGGYSSLLGVSFEPDLFKVAVALVPPTDFGWDLRWVSRSSEALELSKFLSFEDWLRLVDLDLADPATTLRLQQQSPLANSQRLRRPVLLIAGGKDRRVPVRGVIEYAAKLKRQGADITLLIDPEAGHSGGGPLAREARNYLVERSLHRHLGGDAADPPDAQLASYIERTLRLRGSVRSD